MKKVLIAIEKEITTQRKIYNANCRICDNLIQLPSSKMTEDMHNKYTIAAEFRNNSEKCLDALYSSKSKIETAIEYI